MPRKNNRRPSLDKRQQRGARRQGLQPAEAPAPASAERSAFLWRGFPVLATGRARPGQRIGTA